MTKTGAGQQERIVINHMPRYDVCRVPDDIRYQIKVYHLQKYGFRRKYSCGQNKQSFLVTDKERISFQHCEYQEDCARQIETNSRRDSSGIMAVQLAAASPVKRSSAVRRIRRRFDWTRRTALIPVPMATPSPMESTAF